jgi:hypothetical protein
MRISYPAELRVEVGRLETEFLQSPKGKGMLLRSVSWQEGLMMCTVYPVEFVNFLKERGIQVSH